MQTNIKKIAIASAILGIFALISVLLMSNKPDTKRRNAMPKAGLKVDTQVIAPQHYQFTVNSFGTVQPHTQSMLVSQVSGQIINVSDRFKGGGFFEKDDMLIEIDPRDYKAAVKSAKAELLQATATLEQEKASAQQALKDWKNLGRKGEAPALVLRKPQLAAAEASLLAAQANYDKAQLDLERTRIRAPYAGRLKNTQVDLGQYVAANTQLAEVFATDRLEVRLPLKNSELSLINLPERQLHNDKQTAESIALPQVTLISTLGTETHWQGQIVRTEAAIDSGTNQLYVIAQINNPFAPTLDQQGNLLTPLKIGQYVRAEIQGKTIADALIIPNASIYQGSYVYLVEEGRLQRKDIGIGYQNAHQAFVVSGLNANDELITSALGQVTSGTLVSNHSSAQPPASHNTEKVAEAQ